MTIAVTPLLLVTEVMAAGSTYMYLSPSSTTITQGAKLTVDLRENSGNEPVNVVQAQLTYPADKLKVLTIGSSSSFTIKAKEDYKDGSINLIRGAIPSVTGDQSVATITFEVIGVNTTAPVEIDKSNSFIISANDHDNILRDTKDGNYTIVSAPAAFGPAVDTPPLAAKDTRAPKISNLKISGLDSNTPVISWTTSEPSRSLIDYGLNQNYGLSTANDNYLMSHNITLNSPLISPVNLYHFRVKSTDSSGNTATSLDRVFTIKGVSLLITVINQKRAAVAGAKVSFNDKSGLTDENGRVTLGGFPVGKLIGTLIYDHKQTVINVEVHSGGSASSPQRVTFKINTGQDHSWLIVLPIIAMGILLRLLASRPELIRRFRLNF